MRHAERLSFYISTLGLLAVSLLAFTKKERDWIALERDNGKCQAPFPHRCNEKKGVEVHHILTQRYAAKMGIDPEYVDVAENGISLCKNAHNIIHPDRVRAMKEYHKAKAEGRNSFDEMFEEREQKLSNRQIYWNDQYDRQMRVVALKRTQEAKKRGLIFPQKK